MKAEIRRFRNLEWSTIVVTTDPLHASFEGQPAAAEFNNAEELSKSLPSALVDGKPTFLHENPEGWLKKMSRMPYTRLTVTIVEDSE